MTEARKKAEAEVSEWQLQCQQMERQLSQEASDAAEQQLDAARSKHAAEMGAAMEAAAARRRRRCPRWSPPPLPRPVGVDDRPVRGASSRDDRGARREPEAEAQRRVDELEAEAQRRLDEAVLATQRETAVSTWAAATAGGEGEIARERPS